MLLVKDSIVIKTILGTFHHNSRPASGWWVQCLTKAFFPHSSSSYAIKRDLFIFKLWEVGNKNTSKSCACTHLVKRKFLWKILWKHSNFQPNWDHIQLTITTYFLLETANYYFSLMGKNSHHHDSIENTFFCSKILNPSHVLEKRDKSKNDQGLLCAKVLVQICVSCGFP